MRRLLMVLGALLLAWPATAQQPVKLKAGMVTGIDQVGLPIALAAGFGHFEQILGGAHEIDEHFRTAPLEQNAPILLGLLGVWYSSVLGADSRRLGPRQFWQ